jgi:hypothetical protein
MTPQLTPPQGDFNPADTQYGRPHADPSAPESPANWIQQPFVDNVEKPYKNGFKPNAQ